MRKHMTDAEKSLWSKIRKKQLGVAFRRQYSIGPYIVDFYCPEKRVVVEVDGKQHTNTRDYDEYRTSYLEALDIQVIRFWNSEVYNSIDRVITKIMLVCTPPVSPSQLEGDQGGVIAEGSIYRNNL